MERVSRKTSDHTTTPAGTASSVQGASVLGYSHGDAASHPLMVYVVR
jgi:hypothetical protein